MKQAITARNSQKVTHLTTKVMKKQLKVTEKRLKRRHFCHFLPHSVKTTPNPRVFCTFSSLPHLSESSLSSYVFSRTGYSRKPLFLPAPILHGFLMFLKNCQKHRPIRQGADNPVKNCQINMLFWPLFVVKTGSFRHFLALSVNPRSFSPSLRPLSDKTVKTVKTVKNRHFPKVCPKQR